MKLNTLITILAASVPFALVADEPLVKNVAVHQRWPWSPKVDIDYMYAGTCATTLVFTATWDGQTTPVSLVSLNDTGTFSVVPGQHCLTWDPVAAGYGNAELKNFKVSIAPGKDPRTYLVLNADSGGYSFLSDVPEGGWGDAYKFNLIVFRRIPAGTYTLGTSLDDVLSVTGELAAWYKATADSAGVRTVTLTSDFYFSIFLLTGRQRDAIYDWHNTNSRCPIYSISSGTSLRGSVLSDGVTAVDWPTTGYKVGTSSLVAKARAKSAKTGQDELRIDLATEAQWEIAMRAGTTTFYPNGGTNGNTYVELGEIFSHISQAQYASGAAAYNFEVGLKDPNRWGVYDFGVRGELTLDWANYKGYYGSGTQYNISNPPGGVDPVGPVSEPLKGYRILRGNTGPAELTSYLPLSTFTALRGCTTVPEGSLNTGIRLAIHLKPLVDVE